MAARKPTAEPRMEPEVTTASAKQRQAEQYKQAIIDEAVRWASQIDGTKEDLDEAKMAHASAFQELSKDPKHHKPAFKDAMKFRKMTPQKYTEHKRMLAIYEQAFGLDRIQVLPFDKAVEPIV